MTTLYRIYGTIDERDKNGLGRMGKALLYVGITDNYDRRMSQHSEKWWWQYVTKITREEFAARDDAVVAEAQAIKTEAPKYNKALSTAPKPDPAPIPKASKHAVRDPQLSLTEASQYLGVCTKTLRRYIAIGNLPAYRVNGSRLIRVRMSDLDALLSPIPTTGA